MRYVPAKQSTHVAAPSSDHFPAAHVTHVWISACKFAAVAASAREVPAIQLVQVPAEALDHIPAAQIKHLLIASCADAVVPASIKYIPATQSVQIGADALDHFPAAQVEHAIVEADEAFPASQAVHDAPPALAKVSVVEPAAHTAHARVDDADDFPGAQGVQVAAPAEDSVSVTDPASHSKHRSIALCVSGSTPASEMYVPGAQSPHEDAPAPLHLPAAHTEHFVAEEDDDLPAGHSGQPTYIDGGKSSSSTSEYFPAAHAVDGAASGHKTPKSKESVLFVHSPVNGATVHGWDDDAVHNFRENST